MTNYKKDNFEKIIKKLEKLGNDRPNPEDTLHNIARATEGAELSDEEWVNFYRYITTQNREEFEYVARDTIVTLGDLGDEELEKIQKKIAFGEGREVEWYQNGNETTLIVKNITNNNNKEKNGKSLVRPCESIPISPQGCQFESRTPGSLEDIQERISGISCEEDEKGQG